MEAQAEGSSCFVQQEIICRWLYGKLTPIVRGSRLICSPGNRLVDLRRGIAQTFIIKEPGNLSDTEKHQLLCSRWTFQSSIYFFLVSVMPRCLCCLQLTNIFFLSMTNVLERFPNRLCPISPISVLPTISLPRQVTQSPHTCAYFLTCREWLLSLYTDVWVCVSALLPLGNRGWCAALQLSLRDGPQQGGHTCSQKQGPRLLLFSSIRILPCSWVWKLPGHGLNRCYLRSDNQPPRWAAMNPVSLLSHPCESSPVSYEGCDQLHMVEVMVSLPKWGYKMTWALIWLFPSLLGYLLWEGPAAMLWEAPGRGHMVRSSSLWPTASRGLRSVNSHGSELGSNPGWILRWLLPQPQGRPSARTTQSWIPDPQTLREDLLKPLSLRVICYTPWMTNIPTLWPCVLRSQFVQTIYLWDTIPRLIDMEGWCCHDFYLLLSLIVYVILLPGDPTHRRVSGNRKGPVNICCINDTKIHKIKPPIRLQENHSIWKNIDKNVS